MMVTSTTRTEVAPFILTAEQLEQFGLHSNDLRFRLSQSVLTMQTRTRFISSGVMSLRIRRITPTVCLSRSGIRTWTKQEPS